MDDQHNLPTFRVRILQVITLGFLAGLSAALTLRFTLRLIPEARKPLTIEQPCPIMPPSARPGRPRSPITPIFDIYSDRKAAINREAMVKSETVVHGY